MNYLKKSNHGITLVALVITIIVLLVLATIVTKVAIDSGPLKTARRANDSYIIKSEKAEITIGYHNYQEAKDVNKSETLKVKSPSLKDDGQDGPTAEGVLAHVGGDETSGWTIHFTDTKNTYYLDGNGNIDGPHPNGEDPGPAEETNPTTGGGTTPSEDPTPQENTTTENTTGGGETPTPEGTPLKVGDYVDYTYDTVSSGYSLSKTYSGYTSNQTIQQTAGLKWRILGIDNDKVTLISETSTDETVYFQGASGYNNGVYLLNDICAKLYSNSKLGIIAKSLNVDDIGAQMTAAGLEQLFPETETTYTFGSNKTYYPNIYAQEKGQGINSSTVSTTGKERSDPVYNEPTTQTYTRASQSKLTVKDTHIYLLSGSSNYKWSSLFNSGVSSVIFNHKHARNY